jgi:hypothetical protein
MAVISRVGVYRLPLAGLVPLGIGIGAAMTPLMRKSAETSGDIGRFGACALVG